MGHGEVPDMMDETTTDPFNDFELEYKQKPKSIFGLLDYIDTVYESMTTARPPDHVCLEYGWFGQCLRYGVLTTTSTTSETTLWYTFRSTTSTTTTTTDTSKESVCESLSPVRF